MSNYTVRVSKRVFSNGQEIELKAECDFEIRSEYMSASKSLIEQQSEITSKAVALFLSLQTSPISA